MYDATNWQDLSDFMQDWARLPSIRDAAKAGAAGVAADGALLDFTDTGIDTYGLFDMGQSNKAEARWFYTTICSGRVDSNKKPMFASHIPPGIDEGCTVFDNSGPSPVDTGVEQEDAGGPGEQVIVMVRFNHPLITPILTSMWHQLTLRAA